MIDSAGTRPAAGARCPESTHRTRMINSCMLVLKTFRSHERAYVVRTDCLRNVLIGRLNTVAKICYLGLALAIKHSQITEIRQSQPLFTVVLTLYTYLRRVRCAITQRVIPTKWRSYRDRRLCDITSLCVCASLPPSMSNRTIPVGSLFRKAF